MSVSSSVTGDGQWSSALGTQTKVLHHVELKALSFEFCTGVSWEEIIFLSLLIHPRKEAMEKKGLMINAELFCGTGLDLLQKSGDLQYAFSCIGVSNNKIDCNGCKR